MFKEQLKLTCFWKVLLVLCLTVISICVSVMFSGRIVPYLPKQLGKLTIQPVTNYSQLVKAFRPVVTGPSGNRLSSQNVTSCAAMPSWSSRLINPELTSDLINWNFKVRLQCPMTINLQDTTAKREKVTFICDENNNNARMYTSSTTSSSDVMAVPFGDQCLLNVIETCCKDDKVVPNVLHYVWYGKKELGFFHFLSFMSGVRFMRPCLILIHGEFLPYGRYWDYFIRLSPNVVHIKRKRIEVVYGKRLSFPEHGADVMRIEAVQNYGGLYLDFDQVLLRPIQKLRMYEMTMGRVFKDTLGNQFILAQKNATFLKLWHESYKNYKTGHWTWNSLITPFKLSEEHPELIHIDGYNFTRPTYLQTKMIFKQNYDWSTNYAMHLFIRFYKEPINMDIIRTLNTTMGAISRHILFGNKELCES